MIPGPKKTDLQIHLRHFIRMSIVPGIIMLGLTGTLFNTIMLNTDLQAPIGNVSSIISFI